MSGHSKWSKIKHQKAVEDVKRGQVFSKIAAEITAAARVNLDIEANPSLKSAIEKARQANMPKENIDRAIERARASEETNGEPFSLEIYAREGEGVIVEGVTNNKNRVFAQIREILNNHQAKMVSQGAVSWNFENGVAKITKPASPSLAKLLDDLRNHTEVNRVLTDTIEKSV